MCQSILYFIYRRSVISSALSRSCYRPFRRDTKAALTTMSRLLIKFNETVNQAIVFVIQYPSHSCSGSLSMTFSVMSCRPISGRMKDMWAVYSPCRLSGVSNCQHMCGSLSLISPLYLFVANCFSNLLRWLPGLKAYFVMRTFTPEDAILW